MKRLMIIAFTCSLILSNMSAAEFQVQIYNYINTIFSTSSQEIINNFYGAARLIFTSAFFRACFYLAVVLYGVLIMLNKVPNETMAYTAVFSIISLAIVQLILVDSTFYNFFISILDIPREIFLEFVSFGASSGGKINVTDTINQLSASMMALTNKLFSFGSWKNFTAYLFAGIYFITSTFLLFVVLFMILFSTLLAKITLALGIVLLPTLAFLRTQHIFFSWIKLYISLSLYSPFAMLFGIFLKEIGKYNIQIIEMLTDDWIKSLTWIVAIILAQALVALGIFKIPNIINQIVGSAHEGSSMTAGVGTISAGAAIMSAVTKYTGVNVAAGVAKRGTGALAKRGVEAVKDRVQISR
jgi:type IV secretion system protein VirB6